jgi:hypothetical protein
MDVASAKMPKMLLGEVFPEYVMRVKYDSGYGFLEWLRKNDGCQDVKVLVREYIAHVGKKAMSRDVFGQLVIAESSLFALCLYIYKKLNLPNSAQAFSVAMSIAVGQIVNATETKEAESLFGEISNSVPMMFKTASWASAGRHVYEVEPNLSRQLYPDRTTLRGLTGDDLRAPFPALYLSLPIGMAEVYHAESGYHKAVGVMIVEDERWIDGRDFCGPNYEKANMRQQLEMLAALKTDTVSKAWHIEIHGDSKNPDNPLDDCASYYTVKLTADKSPEESAREVLTVRRASMREKNHCDTDPEVLLSVFLYAMNAVVYATNVEGASIVGIPRDVADLKNQIKISGHDRKKKLKRRLEFATDAKRIILRDIETDRTSGEIFLSENSGNGRYLSVRTLVTGHWRRQSCGPKHSERRLTWIRPFWRGPDGADWIHHTRRSLKAEILGSNP